MEALDRAIDVLEVLVNSPDDRMGISEIAAKTGLNKTTVCRILSVFVRRNYVTQSEKRGKYALSMKYLHYACIIKQRLKEDEIARPYLIRLNQQLDETVFLTLWDGKNARHVETIPTKHVIRAMNEEGVELPLYCTAVGKIFLAYNKNEQELETYLNNTILSRVTPDTITNGDELRKTLYSIVQNAVSYNNGEYYPEVRTVAVPIVNAEGSVSAAVGVVAPASRFTVKRMEEVTQEIQQCAREISLALGCPDINPVFRHIKALR